MKIVIIKKWWFGQSWSFQIVAANNKILCSSEKYYNEVDVVNAIALIKNQIRNSKIIYKYPEQE